MNPTDPLYLECQRKKSKIIFLGIRLYLQWLIVEETKPTLTAHKDREVKSTLRLIDEKETSLGYNQLVFKKELSFQISNHFLDLSTSCFSHNQNGSHRN
jgi:hypothetical protein